MGRTIRFHFDEHIDSTVAEGLRRRRADVSTTAERHLIGQMIHTLELLEPSEMKNRVEFL